MKTPVESLLKEPFLRRTPKERLQIVLAGKPRPHLRKLKCRNLKGPRPGPGCPSTVDLQTGFHVLIFDVSTYDHVEWLTGCDVRQALFCWSCLLFIIEKSDWNYCGFKELNSLPENLDKHSKSVSHLQAELSLRIFLECISVGDPAPILPEKELITRNREIARRVIDVICFLVSQQKPPRSGTRDRNTLEIEDCLENLQFLRDYDLLQTSLIDDATDMLQITPKIITDMIDSIASVMRACIGKETHKSTFVSMIVSEHYGDPTKSQFSTVLRYLRRGEVCERFIEFRNTDGIKSPPMILRHINKIINEFQISRRVVGYSFDGSVLHSVQAMSEVKIQLQFRYPYIAFVPCHFHKLDHVLQKSLFYLRECDIFFKNLEAMGSYFEKGSDLLRLLETSTGAKVPNLKMSESTNHSEFFYVIKEYRKCLLDFSDFVVHNSDKVTASDIVKVSGLRTFLTDFKTMFLVEAFLRLFDLVAPLSEASRSPVPGSLFDPDLIESVLKSFEVPEEDPTYERIWYQAVSDFEDLQREQNTMVRISPSKKLTFQRLYTDIVRSMSAQIKYRFENGQKMTFFRILDMKKNDEPLSPYYVRSLVNTYGQGFQYSEIDKEIKLLNTQIQSYESVEQLLKFLMLSNLEGSLPSLYKICELVLTLACTQPTSGGVSSKLQDINSWSYTPVKHEIAGDLSLLCIEQDYLKELKGTTTFYDEVLQKFQEKNKTMDLLYK